MIFSKSETFSVVSGFFLIMSNKCLILRISVRRFASKRIWNSQCSDDVFIDAKNNSSETSADFFELKYLWIKNP